MEVFDGVVFVRLRSVGRRDRDEYLAADTDGWNICVSDQDGALNTVWAVHRVASLDGLPCVTFRGAYGYYLFHDGTLHQEGLDESSPPRGFLWQVARWEESFVLRSATGGYLSADGPCRSGRRIPTSAGHTGGTMMLWDIENVPARLTRACALVAAPQLPARPSRLGVLNLPVRYTVAKDDESLDQAIWTTIRVSTSKLQEVRMILEYHSGVAGTSLCVRAGRYGELQPLLIDLPVNTRCLDLVLLPEGTQVLHPAFPYLSWWRNKLRRALRWCRGHSPSGPPPGLLGALPAAPSDEAPPLLPAQEEEEEIPAPAQQPAAANAAPDPPVFLVDFKCWRCGFEQPTTVAAFLHHPCRPPYY